jgi:hypothetical protein
LRGERFNTEAPRHRGFEGILQEALWPNEVKYGHDSELRAKAMDHDRLDLKWA